MPHITTQYVIDAIKAGTYPDEVQKIIRFVAGKQAYKVFPFVEVEEVSPYSENDAPEIKTNEQGFEIRVHYRYGRTLDRDTTIIEGIETEILEQLDLADFTHGELFYQDRKWSRAEMRGDADTGLYGNVSTLRLNFREYSPTDAGTYIGAGTTLNVGGTVLTLIRGSTGSHGRDYANAQNDVGDNYPITGRQSNHRTFECKYKRADWDAIGTMIDTGNYVSVTLTEGANVTTWSNALPVYQRDTVDYAGLKVILLEIQIQK